MIKLGKFKLQEKKVSGGWKETNVDYKNDNLWLLLHRQASHEKLDVKVEEKPSLLLETICFRMGKVGCPNLWCHSNKDVLMLEKASNGGDTGNS